MKERDMRQAAYNSCKKSQRNEMILTIAPLSGMGLILGFALAPLSFYLGCGTGLFFIVPIYISVRAFRKRHKKELGVISRGMLTEAEVVELKEEKYPDSDGQLRTMAVYEFTLPSGRTHRFKESVTSSMAGALGQIRVGTRLPLFVDGENPDNYNLVKPKLTTVDLQDLARQPDMEDIDSPILDKYLRREKELGNLSNRNFMKGKISLWVFGVLLGILFAVVLGGIGFMVYDNWRNLRHDDIELPFGTYISSIGTTEVYQYFPETT